MSLFSRNSAPSDPRLDEIRKISERMRRRANAWTMAREGDDTPLVDAIVIEPNAWEPFADLEGAEVQRIGVDRPGVEVFAFRIQGAFPEHRHDYEETLIVVEGVLTIRVQVRGRWQSHTLTENQRIIIPPMVRHEGIASGPYTVLTINRTTL